MKQEMSYIVTHEKVLLRKGGFENKSQCSMASAACFIYVVSNSGYSEAPFNVSQVKVLPHLKLNFSDSKPKISVLNNLHLRFRLISCSNPLVSKQKHSNGSFTINRVE
jgi:hypothetical protein